jgi:hypothetical protein
MQAQLIDELPALCADGIDDSDDVIFRIVHARPSAYKRPTASYDMLGMQVHNWLTQALHVFNVLIQCVCVGDELSFVNSGKDAIAIQLYKRHSNIGGAHIVRDPRQPAQIITLLGIGDAQPVHTRSLQMVESLRQWCLSRFAL